MTKKDIYKLTPGTWLEIRWDDGPPEAALLLAKPQPGRGDVSLQLYFPRVPEANWHAVHSQVTRVLGPLVLPSLA